MEIEKLFGLPAHPLFVHVPIVLLPLAAVGTLIIALRPSWRHRFGWTVAVLAVVGAIGAVLAAGSGEPLEETLRRSEPISDTLRDHAELGETTRLLAVLFALAVVALMTVWELQRRRAQTGTAAPSSGVGKVLHHRRAVAALAVVSVALGALTTVWVIQTGHSGAKSTWEDVGQENG